MIAGYAIGGGHVLHLICDLSIAADNARFGQVGTEGRVFRRWIRCRPAGRPGRGQEGQGDLVPLPAVQRAGGQGNGSGQHRRPAGRLETETVAWCREMLRLSPFALRLMKASFNAAEDGYAGIQQLAHDANLLFYATDEAKEGGRGPRRSGGRSSNGSRAGPDHDGSQSPSRQTVRGAGENAGRGGAGPVPAARVARLATVSEAGAPHLVPVTFAVIPGTSAPPGVVDTERPAAESTELIVFAIDHKPKSTTALRRLDNIAANPRVAFLVDVYDDNWDRLWWVRADAVARVIDPNSRGEAVVALRTKYPQYDDRPPDGTLVGAAVLGWSGWQAAP